MSQWQQYSNLIQALGIPDFVRCICAVGAGGKTSLLHRLAEEYRAQGRKVLLTTTTKMYLPKKYAALDRSAEEILTCLEQDSFVTAGTTVSEEKMGPLPLEIWKDVVRGADVVLVEADGSRRLPLKVPGAGEPVLPAECDFLIAVEGLSGIGQPLEQVCHRLEQATKLLGCPGTQTVTEKMVAQLARKGYQRFLDERIPAENGNAENTENIPNTGFSGSSCYFFNQADCLSEEQKNKIAEAMEGTDFVLGSLREGSYLKKLAE